MKVAVITTGVMELHGLVGALARFFPGHDFHAIARVPAMPGRAAEPFDGFTSNPVKPSDAFDPASTLRKLIAQLAGCVYPTAGVFDLAVLLDDLELVNLRQPAVVTETVRAAVGAHVEAVAAVSPHAARDAAKALRERASFHLAVPMAESWFYATPNAMRDNKVPAGRVPALVESDPEDFETADALFSSDGGAECVQLLDRNRRRRENRRPPWEVSARPGMPWHRRERHPKAYLQWLCRDPSENSCTAWKESREGASALAGLDWSAVLSTPSHYPFLRAMLHDLADGLGGALPTVAGPPDGPTTLRPVARRSALRNL